MLETAAVVLSESGLTTSHAAGGFIHIILMVAEVAVLILLVRGRSFRHFR